MPCLARMLAFAHSALNCFADHSLRVWVVSKLAESVGLSRLPCNTHCARCRVPTVIVLLLPSWLSALS